MTLSLLAAVVLLAVFVAGFGCGRLDARDQRRRAHGLMVLPGTPVVPEPDHPRNHRSQS